jgi:MarR family 2-MHQ and catechol resistance regulon transcriptional repressor
MSRDIKKIQPDDTWPDGLHVWLVLWKAYEAVRRYATDQIAMTGLGLSDFAILELLLHKGPSAVNAIGAKVGLTSGSMTIAVDRLESRGLVERKPDAGDRRSRQVCLTTAGRKLIEREFARHQETLNSLGEVLTPADRRRLVQLLKKLGTAAAARARH